MLGESKKTAIVTGADGFIGRELVSELAKNNYDVFLLLAERDNSATTQEGFTYPVAHCDMCNYENLVSGEKHLCVPAKFRNSIFFHLAWQGSAGKLRSDYKTQLENVKYTCDAVLLAKKLEAKRFVGVGSIMEDESNHCVPCDGFEPMATFQYSTAKYAAHLMAKTVANKIGIEFVWGKISNAYGASDTTNRFINSLIQKLMEGEDFDLSHCEQYYDFVYITEVARAFRLIGENGRCNHSYYIGSGEAQPLKNFVNVISSKIESKSKLNYGALSGQPVMLDVNFFDCSKTKKHTGFECRVDFESGIDKTIKGLYDEKI